MNSPKTIEAIRQIQAYQQEENIKTAEVIRRVHASGSDVSGTVIRRICTPGAELEDSFNYDLSIAPVARALFGKDNSAEARALLAIIGVKNEQLEEKNAQIQECNRRLAFLRDQIEKKDQYMQIKDEIILRFLNVLFPKQDESEEGMQTAAESK